MKASTTLASSPGPADSRPPPPISRSRSPEKPPAYDAIKTCKSAGWTWTSNRGAATKSACKSTLGAYQLDLVALGKGSGGTVAAAGPVPAVVTLLEADAAGKLIPVDRASIDLPAEHEGQQRLSRRYDGALICTRSSRRPRSLPGRSLTGQVTDLEPFLPGVAAGVGKPASGLVVKLTVPRGKDSLQGTTRTTKTNSNGFYAFEDLPACGPKDWVQGRG